MKECTECKEWEWLIQQAKDLGMTPDEVRYIIDLLKPKQKTK